MCICFLTDAKNSPELPPNTSDEGSCWEAAVTVDDEDAGDWIFPSVSLFDVRAGGGSAGGVAGGARVGSAFWSLDGLLPVMGLQTLELSSGQRKTSIGPCVLFKETW